MRAICSATLLAIGMLLPAGQATVLADNHIDEPPEAELQHRDRRQEDPRTSRRERAFRTSAEAYEATRDAYRALVDAISATNDARLAARTQEGRDAWAAALSDLENARGCAWRAEQHAWDASQ